MEMDLKEKNDTLSNGNDLQNEIIGDETEPPTLRMEESSDSNSDSKDKSINNLNVCNMKISERNTDSYKADTYESTDTQQALQADMKSRFLWSVSALNGRQTKASMFEGIVVEGVCRGVDKDITNMHMQNMKTPFASYPFATIRLPDCFALNFKI